MANFLILDKPQVFVGLGTLTYVLTSSGLYNVQFSTTVPRASPTGDGAGSGTGLGSGAGGGTLGGFALGGGGTGKGATGQGFGADSAGYPQPPSSGSNETSGTAVSSALSVLVKDNGSTVFTAPTLSTRQSSMQFKYSFSGTSGHTITVVLASANASDNTLNGVISTITIGQGE